MPKLTLSVNSSRCLFGQVNFSWRWLTFRFCQLGCDLWVFISTSSFWVCSIFDRIYRLSYLARTLLIPHTFDWSLRALGLLVNPLSGSHCLESLCYSFVFILQYVFMSIIPYFPLVVFIRPFKCSVVQHCFHSAWEVFLLHVRKTCVSPAKHCIRLLVVKVSPMMRFVLLHFVSRNNLSERWLSTQKSRGM